MIKVLIVDDIPETRDHLSRLLGLERDRGCLLPGAQADAVALDKDLHVIATWIAVFVTALATMPPR